MQQDEFRKWLVAQGQTEATASSRASSAKRVEQYLGDLDELFAQEDRDSILNRFAYSAEDERAERPNPSPVPIDGVLRTGLASLQQALKLYHSFLTEQSNVPDKAEHRALVDRLTRKEIDAAMQECDQLGLKAFLARGGFASPQVWVGDEGNEQSYPAKATVAAALAHLPDGRALSAKEFFNGFGEAQSFARLEALGYQIRRKGSDVADHQSLLDRLTRKEIEAAIRECDEMGLAAFLARGGYADGATQFQDDATGRSYPAKATVAAALGHLPGGRALPMKEFFGGQGGPRTHAVLEKLGYRVLHGSEDASDQTFSRERIEAAMDAFDEFRASGAHADVFSGFDEPKTYWVRSTKARENRRFPTKPIVGYLLGKSAQKFVGGWSTQYDAAARLHAAGYIVVDQNDLPLPLPEQYAHLMRGADRARLVALNYFIAPAREAGQPSITIRAGDLHDMAGLVKNWANVCQALEGEMFQKLASVPAPTRSGPERSTTTEYTFVLAQDGAAKDIPMPHAVQTATTNLILYGPPGTGKTYQTAWEAVRLCLGDAVAADLSGESNRDRLMAEYRRLMSEGRIEFVTFHQSMSYEEFVEGLRPGIDGDDPSENGAGFRLEPVAGIFQRVARRAEATVWDGASTGQDADEAMPDAPEPDVAVSVPPETESSDNRDRQPQQGLENDLFTLGQLPPVRDGTFRKLAQDVAQELAQAHPQGFSLQQYREALVRSGRETGIEPTGGWEKHNMPTWASHPDQAWLVPADAAAVEASSFPRTHGGPQTSDATVRVEHNTSAAHVLIIDEINRANISKVFGELITLLEPDKRLGRRDEIQLTLPYSKKRFGVPQNLHIIGTMNTADRSIALLDTALRRRFTFKELMPNPAVLSPNVGGINLQKLLTTINDRIEYLFDREHQIGHAYFTGCKSAEEVEDVMRHKVIPLLSEYFYEDWSKVAAVLGDGPQGPSRFLEARRLDAPPGLAADDFGAERLRWRVKDQFDFSEFAA
ncbi:hypothetical protein GCM10007291_42180 [Gemmobacter nanjingensis]|uniref:AAA+ ATPase domain-containing protein n=1 Tax=Gemmobacter nanjingensis TaxID=488454 RepID=A0ABQ3FRI6_9RHOB|nr:AAA family ATPase [Gemmobacter nanjingensis]GHC36332.1 hypothetical protein GCM10007291_42180 [Gemmobacter nanjingensis]